VKEEAAAEAMPTGSGIYTVPNLLSLARIAAVPVFVWLFLTDREDAAVLVYAGGALTDFFDGFIARRTGSVTKLGQLLDPLADRVFIVALAIALVARDVLAWWLAVVIVVRDVLILALFPALERRGIERIQVNFVGKTATAALLFGLTWLAFSQTSFFVADAGSAVGNAFTGLGAALYWVAAWQYGREALQKLRASR